MCAAREKLEMEVDLSPPPPPLLLAPRLWWEERWAFSRDGSRVPFAVVPDNDGMLGRRLVWEAGEAIQEDSGTGLRTGLLGFSDVW